MAIKIRDAGEDQGPKNLYTGLAIMKPLCVCPNKAQLAKMGIEVEEPNYVTSEEKDGKYVPKVRLAFYLYKKIGEGENAENLVVQHSIFLDGAVRYSKDKEKVECIDKYGKSCFVTKEEFLAKEIPYDWIDAKSISACLGGQADLISFMKTIAAYKKENEMSLNDVAVNGEAKTLFAKDGSGLAEIRKDVLNISKMQNNTVKVLLGVKITEDGKMYQEVFPYAIGRGFTKTNYFHKELIKLEKSKSRYLEYRDYGPIDLSRDIANEEDYRLRLFEDTGATAEKPAAKEGGNGYPEDWDKMPAGDNPFAEAEVVTENPEKG